jgi:hypothetical protein
MKKLILPALIIIGVLSVRAQTDKAALLQSLEANQSQNQSINQTATIKTSTRLFKIKDDLTSVILIIPTGTVVSVLDSDSTYFHVTFEENEGYIYSKHAALDKVPGTFKEMQSAQTTQDIQRAQAQTDSRYEALVSKYGSTMADRLYTGKIWKGMSSDMARDSWGAAARVNRVIKGNVIEEEWIYRSTWLHFENGTLIQWGPVKK